MLGIQPVFVDIHGVVFLQFITHARIITITYAAICWFFCTLRAQRERDDFLWKHPSMPFCAGFSWFNIIAEHAKCGRATKAGQAHFRIYTYRPLKRIFIIPRFDRQSSSEATVIAAVPCVWLYAGLYLELAAWDRSCVESFPRPAAWD